jgi:hypothetical protein
VLKKNELKPWRKEYCMIPGRPNAEFVCAMEQVLEVFQRPCDPSNPVVCMDESPWNCNKKMDGVIRYFSESGLASLTAAVSTCGLSARRGGRFFL